MAEQEQPQRRGHLTEDRVMLLIEDSIERSGAKFEARIRQYLDERFQTQNKFFSDAFPNGDPHGHRMSHEREMRSAEQWAKLKFSVMEKLVSGSLWGGGAFILYLLFEALRKAVQP